MKCQSLETAICAECGRRHQIDRASCLEFGRMALCVPCLDREHDAVVQRERQRGELE